MSELQRANINVKIPIFNILGVNLAAINMKWLLNI
jgi:hypothetical protein